VKRVVIDTNVLISFVTVRNPQQQALAAPLFEEASKGKCTIICPNNVLAEFAYVLNRVYAVPKHDVAAMMKEFIAMPGVTIVGDISFDCLFQWWPDEIPEYGDAVVAAVAKGVKTSAVATFDKKMAASLERLNIPLYVWKQA